MNDELVMEEEGELGDDILDGLGLDSDSEESDEDDLEGSVLAASDDEDEKGWGMD